MTTAEKLRRLLRNSNKSAIAKDAGIHPNTLFLIVSGKSGLSIATASALAKALVHCHASDLG